MSCIAKSHPDFFLSRRKPPSTSGRKHIFPEIKAELSQGSELAQSMPCGIFQPGLSERGRPLGSVLLFSVCLRQIQYYELIVTSLALWLCNHCEQKYPVSMLCFMGSSFLTISFQARVSPMDWSKAIQAYKDKARLHYPRRPFCSRDKLQGRF